MKLPFGGLFGDSCETRLLQFLLPMYDIEFDMAELIEEIGLTRQSIAKAMKKFSDRGMVKVRKEGRTPLYSINEESPLVKRLEDFDNSLIESMIGPEEFDRIRRGDAKPARVPVQKHAMKGAGKAAVTYPHPRTRASGVASSPAEYGRKEKR